jgi:hypothetical protein
MNDSRRQSIKGLVIPSGVFVNQTVGEMEAIVTLEPWLVLSRIKCPTLSPAFKAYGKYLKAASEAAIALDALKLPPTTGTSSWNGQLIVAPRAAAPYSQVGCAMASMQLLANQPAANAAPAVHVPAEVPAPTAWSIAVLTWFSDTYSMPLATLLNIAWVVKNCLKYIFLLLLLGMLRQPKLGIRLVCKIISWLGSNLADSLTETIADVALAPPENAVSHHVQVNDDNTLVTVVGIVSSFGTYMLVHMCGALQAMAP